MACRGEFRDDEYYMEKLAGYGSKIQIMLLKQKLEYLEEKVRQAENTCELCRTSKHKTESCPVIKELKKLGNKQNWGTQQNYAQNTYDDTVNFRDTRQNRRNDYSYKHGDNYSERKARQVKNANNSRNKNFQRHFRQWNNTHENKFTHTYKLDKHENTRTRKYETNNSEHYQDSEYQWSIVEPETYKKHKYDYNNEATNSQSQMRTNNNRDRRKAKTNTVARKDSKNERKSVRINTLIPPDAEIENNKKIPKVNMKIGNLNVKSAVDNSASMSTISKTFFQKCKYNANVDYLEHDLVVQTVSGEKCSLNNTVGITFKVDNKMYAHEFYITEENGKSKQDIVLGADFLCENKELLGSNEINTLRPNQGVPIETQDGANSMKTNNVVDDANNMSKLAQLNHVGVDGNTSSDIMQESDLHTGGEIAVNCIENESIIAKSTCLGETQEKSITKGCMEIIDQSDLSDNFFESDFPSATLESLTFVNKEYVGAEVDEILQINEYDRKSIQNATTRSVHNVINNDSNSSSTGQAINNYEEINKPGVDKNETTHDKSMDNSQNTSMSEVNKSDCEDKYECKNSSELVKVVQNNKANDNKIVEVIEPTLKTHDSDDCLGVSEVKKTQGAVASGVKRKAKSVKYSQSNKENENENHSGKSVILENRKFRKDGKPKPSKRTRYFSEYDKREKRKNTAGNEGLQHNDDITDLEDTGFNYNDIKGDLFFLNKDIYLRELIHSIRDQNNVFKGGTILRKED